MTLMNIVQSFHYKTQNPKYKKINRHYLIMREAQCLNCQVQATFTKSQMIFKFD